MVRERDQYRDALVDAIAAVSRSPVTYMPWQAHTPQISVAQVDSWRAALSRERKDTT